MDIPLNFSQKRHTENKTENKTTKDKNGENVPHLEITEVVLAHCNMVNNDYQQLLFQINLLVVY